MAKALRDWIPLVLQSVTPWMSKSDIQAGERWQEALGGELESCDFGIICVTPENVDAPWVLFEAGALGKSMEGRVVPLLLGLDLQDISGPLAQFQAKKADHEGIEDVLRAINEASDQSVPEATIRQISAALWPEMQKELDAIPGEEPDAPPRRQTKEVLEELVVVVRNLDMRVDQTVDLLMDQRDTDQQVDAATERAMGAQLYLELSQGIPGHDLGSQDLHMLTLVAQGRSARSIAAEYRTSVRSVERRVQDVYGKLRKAWQARRIAEDFANAEVQEEPEGEPANG